MRFHLFAAVLLAGCAAPAFAQSEQVERRVNKLEQEMRAVQRKVFPGGAGAIVEPEIRPQTQMQPLGGAPAGSAVADLTARVDALEAQLARITGQAEQNSFRVRQLEDSLASFRASMQARFAELESARTAQAAAPADQPRAEPAALQTAATPPRTDTKPAAAADPGEEAYLVGYRLWDQRKFTEAQSALEGMAKKFPKHMRASYARNLAGRAYLDDNKPATAAKVFLSNYQIDPKGERAADSLLFLGEALMKLGKPVEACKVYDELQDVYGPNMRDFVKQRLPQARSEAKCK
jgi:TolA-binding protein